MSNVLQSQQFGRTTANSAHTSTNGQGSETPSSNPKSETPNGTQTVISIKGSAPNISTRA